MSVSPLSRLVSQRGVEVSASTVEAFLEARGPALLIFTGDPKVRAEAQDVAIVAQELTKQAGADVPLGVVSEEGDFALQQRFGVTVFPSVVFLRDGQRVSLVAKVQDWAVYSRAAQLWLSTRKALEVKS